MKVLITGASGFLGQELASSLLTSPSIETLILTDLKLPPVPSSVTRTNVHEKINRMVTDLSSTIAVRSLLSSLPDLSAVFLFHGIMSGASEADLDLGLRVNLNATMDFLNILRVSHPGIKVIYASVLAAFGPIQPGGTITEFIAPSPQSSYGTQKVMIETLINDFSRRGLIDGRVLRLPTIMPRAGAPTGAASSFVSDIIREPFNGRKTCLPIRNKNLGMFVCSPRTITKNFQIAMTIPKHKFEKYLSRTVIMPGVVVTVQDIFDALVEISPSGRDILNLIDESVSESTERIVESWPCDYNFSRALELGFVEDISLLENLRDYFEKYIKT